MSRGRWSSKVMTLHIFSMSFEEPFEPYKLGCSRLWAKARWKHYIIVWCLDILLVCKNCIVSFLVNKNLSWSSFLGDEMDLSKTLSIRSNTYYLAKCWANNVLNTQSALKEKWDHRMSPFTFLFCDNKDSIKFFIIKSLMGAFTFPNINALRCKQICKQK